MTLVSRSIDELAKQEYKSSNENYWASPVNSREEFEKAQIKLDPSIYKGGPAGYRNEWKTKSSLEILEEMAKRSPSLGQLLKNNYSATPMIGEVSGKTPNNYSGSFEDVARQYLSSDARELYAHLKSKGREFYDITRIGTADLGSAVAALAVYGDEAALLGADDFEKKVTDFSLKYSIPKSRAEKYIMAHEFVHASQKGMPFDRVSLESDVEHTLKEYFSERGDADLAYVAGERLSSVVANYTGADSYSKAA